MKSNDQKKKLSFYYWIKRAKCNKILKENRRKSIIESYSIERLRDRNRRKFYLKMNPSF